MDDRDQDKLDKAGYATPRGGDKNGYQNHVVRSNRVILPYELIDDRIVSLFTDGYIVRLLPGQAFAAPGVVATLSMPDGEPIEVGRNAFVLYKSWADYDAYRPPAGWSARGLQVDGRPVDSRRSSRVEDHGHYLLRLPRLGGRSALKEGPPQGIFAIEYADAATNYQSQVLLAWLICRSEGSTYADSEWCKNLELILDRKGLMDEAGMKDRGVLSADGVTCCPLCGAELAYDEFHETVSFSNVAGLANAGAQVQGSTRSTKVNLFHLQPLSYMQLVHRPKNVGWGHAICNTLLGQRGCPSLSQLKADGSRLMIEQPGYEAELYGWMDSDAAMIRSDEGDVWIKLNARAVQALVTEDEQ